MLRAALVGIAMFGCMLLPSYSIAQHGRTVPQELVAQIPDAPTGRLAHVLQRGTLIVGVKDDYPPWGMRDATGAIVGLEIDLARDLADRMGVGLELEAVTASNRISVVNQGRVDVIIATTGDTTERRQQVDVLLPNYYSSGVVVYGRDDVGVAGWEDLRGEKICLNRGAFYNRSLEEDYGIDGQYFASGRDSQLALKQGRCIGWAFDDTALTQLIRGNADRSNGAGPYSVMTEAILISPWAVLVAQGEGDGDLGRFVSDMIGEWHASGRIIALQDKWQVPRSAFVDQLHQTWQKAEAGRALCARDAETGRHPDQCLIDAPVQSVPPDAPPEWVDALYQLTGFDLRAVATPYNAHRLLRALGLTLSLSVIAIVGALCVGVVLSVLQVLLGRLGFIGRLLLVPQRVLITVARMTPPILQLYIVFFGLGGLLSSGGGAAPSGFVIAAAILSLYAGATTTIILSHEMTSTDLSHMPVLWRLPGAMTRAFDGLVATSVNIVKAAGLASAIAVSELVSTVDLVVSEGADTATMMNALLIFYFFFVLCILWLFNALRYRMNRP